MELAVARYKIEDRYGFQLGILKWILIRSGAKPFA